MAKVEDGIRWFKSQFGQATAAAFSGTPFTLDLLTAIAVQETYGDVWGPLFLSQPADEVLRLCVGDTIDWPKRRAFPRTKADLLKEPQGDAMFEVARSALEEIAEFNEVYGNVFKSYPDKFCHGFGIFQYDIQHFKTNPQFFIEKKWYSFSECLVVFRSELEDALKRAYPSGKSKLTDDEAVYVAIAYNAGSVDFSLGFKQGHRNPGDPKYYGEYVSEYLAQAKTIAPAPLPAVQTEVSTSSTIAEITSSVRPLTPGLVNPPAGVGSPRAAPGTAVGAPQASPATFAEKLMAAAFGEWNFFGKQTYDMNGNTVTVGHKEGEDGFYQRVAAYWLDGTNTRGIDGRDHEWPWSAAFISWCVKTSGAGNRFRYSTQHSVYIAQAIRDHLNGQADAGYWAWRLNEIRPSAGDIVCWSREPGVDYDHQKGGDYKGHCDIILTVGAGFIEVIGGNVGDSVTKRPLQLTPAAFIQPTVQHGETLFAVMQNRMDLPMS
jgi:hypothetical protein